MVFVEDLRFVIDIGFDKILNDDRRWGGEKTGLGPHRVSVVEGFLPHQAIRVVMTVDNSNLKLYCLYSSPFHRQVNKSLVVTVRRSLFLVLFAIPFVFLETLSLV